MSIVEKELTRALLNFSFGKMSLEQVEETAKRVAPNYDLNNEMLMHKGINWYAKQIIANM